LPGRPVRGRLVRLGPLADALLTRHDNHPTVTSLAGQALALAAALATALRFRGSFSLQAKGDGAVPMLLADCTESGALRGYARAEPERLTAVLAQERTPSARALLGNGYLAFTVDQGSDAERHQGIVAIDGESLADMALHYFETSEQIRCSVRLACRHTDAGWRAGALILERIAGEGGIDPELDDTAQDEAWRTATALAATLRDQELLDDTLPADRLLYNLFGLEGVAADRHRALASGCRCSRARLSGILEGFSTDDLNHMAPDGDIVMTCEFCNLDFRFGRDEVRGQADPQPES
jgi:molecular chaperone Hsp33